jgi:hypothetical protein
MTWVLYLTPGILLVAAGVYLIGRACAHYDVTVDTPERDHTSSLNGR